MKIQTLKGFRDFLPESAKKRQYVINTLRSVFEVYGFEPLETPALEYEEILTGKYGEEGDKLMYRFTDLGGRRVAMRYDQTVPLARVVAQYANVLPFPFKRYQIQPVWRAENPQRGRFREFLQCDIDTVGTSSAIADAEVIAAAAKSFEALGIKNYKILINDRMLFPQLNPNGFINDEELAKAIRSLDKLKKIGEQGVIEDMQKNGFSFDTAKAIVANAKSLKENDNLLSIFKYLEEFGLRKGEQFIFSPELARGLDYYTSTIFEFEIESYSTGSVCGGGRYDELIGMFAGRKIPAVGCAFGFDRIIEAMEEKELFPAGLTSTTKVLVTIFSQQLLEQSIKACSIIRINGINSDLYPDEAAKMEKQLKYANQKQIPYVMIIGPEEKQKGFVTLRNMKTREQKAVVIDEAVKTLKEN